MAKERIEFRVLPDRSRRIEIHPEDVKYGCEAYDWEVRVAFQPPSDIYPKKLRTTEPFIELFLEPFTDFEVRFKQCQEESKAEEYEWSPLYFVPQSNMTSVEKYKMLSESSVTITGKMNKGE